MGAITGFGFTVEYFKFYQKTRLESDFWDKTEKTYQQLFYI